MTNRISKSEMDDLSQNVSINAIKANMSDGGVNSGLLKCNCCKRRASNTYGQLEMAPTYACRYRYCCKWFCIIGPIMLALFLIILFAAYIPSTTQTLMDNASLIQLYTAMINPTNDSIGLNTTLQIVNSGGYDGVIDSCAASLSWNGQQIGTFTQPEISITGGTGATFHLLTDVKMKSKAERDVFRNMSKYLLSGNDVVLSFSAKPTVHIKIAGIKIASVNVNLDKDLVVKGSKLQNPYIRNIDIIATPNATIVAVAISEIEFSISSTLYIYGGTVKMNISDAFQNQLGYAVIPNMALIPGYNKLSNITTVMVACSNCSNSTGSNMNAIINFVQNYQNGYNQGLNIKGPLAGLVISDTIDEDAEVYGFYDPSDEYIDFYE